MADRDRREIAHAQTVEHRPSAERARAIGSPAALAAGSRLGRFMIVEVLGEGGMGVVYAAFDPDLDRKVAIKLLRADALGDSRSSRGRERFLREARAMAKLSHPNVLTVHEVGTVEDEVFIAMEFAPGGTLREWCERTSRSWREILDAFVAAGRGLAAAHTAGLVHRDFKPDNVLITADGRFCVADFGVAGTSSTALPAADDDASADQTATELEAPELSLTRTGTLLGTPLYMAPEQQDGRSASAAADQFSFCVALYELLYGERPFRGTTFGELSDAIYAGVSPSPPRHAEVPAWVHAALVRGLASDPDRRFPSMQALVEVLEADPEAERKQRNRSRIVRGTIAVLAGLAVFGLVRGFDEPSPRCRGFESHLAGVWDDRTRAAIEKAFLATGTSTAAETFAHLTAALDAHAKNWVAARVDACEDTRVRGDQSEALMDLRMRCLDRRLVELRALTSLLANEADETVLLNSVSAVHSLRGADSCEQTDALSPAFPLPANPRSRARIEQLRAALADGVALEAAGKYEEALAHDERVLAQAEQLDFPPVTAEAAYRLASAQESTGAQEAATATLRRAVRLAERARDDALRADTTILLARVVGVHRAQLAEGLGLAQDAAAICDRLPPSPAREGRLHDTYGVLLDENADYEEAMAHYERALAAWSKTESTDSPRIAYTLTNQGLLYLRLNKYEKARAAIERALAILTKSLGPNHPSVAMALTNLGNVHEESGNADRAIELFERALAIDESVFGSSHPNLASDLNNLANALSDKGETARAIGQLRRAAEIYEAELGPDHPHLAVALSNLGIQLHAAGDSEAAREHYQRALAIKERALGERHPSVANTLLNLGELLQERGQHARALAQFERALAIYENALGAGHPDVALTLVHLGDVLRERNELASALRQFERANEICAAEKCAEAVQATARFGIARCSWRTGGDRKRAVNLAAEALEQYRGLPEQKFGVDRERVEAWLRTHRAP